MRLIDLETVGIVHGNLTGRVEGREEEENIYDRGPTHFEDPALVGISGNVQPDKHDGIFESVTITIQVISQAS